MEVISNLIEAHIFRKAGTGIEFLLLKRGEGDIYPGLWQMVTGAIDDGESAYRAAIREIKEETGLTPSKLWVVPNVNSFYSPQRNRIVMIPVFAALVERNAVIEISHEHTEYKWVSAEEAIKSLAWVGQRKSVEIILDYFINNLTTLNFVEINL